MNNTQTNYIDYIINGIGVSFLIDNTNDRSLGIISLKINGLIIILLNCNINNKTAIKVFTTNITNINNSSMIKYSIFGYNYISKWSSAISEIWLIRNILDTYFLFSSISLFTLLLWFLLYIKDIFNIRIVANILLKVLIYTSNVNKSFRNYNLFIIQFGEKSGVL